jgi:hypothetical protein
MKRIITVLAVVAVMAAILAASALPALASAFGNEHANCVGRDTSDTASANPRFFGEGVSEAARDSKGLGPGQSENASTNCDTR